MIRPELPCGAPKSAAPIRPAQDGFCDLCGETIDQADVSVEAFEASALLICRECLEHMLETDREVR